jgi:hypothetical protein
VLDKLEFQTQFVYSLSQSKLDKFLELNSSVPFVSRLGQNESLFNFSNTLIPFVVSGVDTICRNGNKDDIGQLFHYDMLVIGISMMIAMDVIIINYQKKVYFIFFFSYILIFLFSVSLVSVSETVSVSSSISQPVEQPHHNSSTAHENHTPINNFNQITELDERVREIQKDIDSDEAVWIADMNRPRESLNLWKNHLPKVKIFYAMNMCCDESSLLEFVAKESGWLI